jgi:hypothetical protein
MPESYAKVVSLDSNILMEWLPLCWLTAYISLKACPQQCLKRVPRNLTNNQILFNFFTGHTDRKVPRFPDTNFHRTVTCNNNVLKTKFRSSSFQLPAWLQFRGLPPPKTLWQETMYNSAIFLHQMSCPLGSKYWGYISKPLAGLNGAEPRSSLPYAASSIKTI